VRSAGIGGDEVGWTFSGNFIISTFGFEFSDWRQPSFEAMQRRIVAVDVVRDLSYG
jgi:hypothetical protein